MLYQYFIIYKVVCPNQGIAASFSLTARVIMPFCPVNESLIHPWENGGLNRCFVWTLWAGVCSALSLIALIIYLAYLCRSSRRAEVIPKSCAFRIQISLSVITILTVLAHAFAYVIGNDKGVVAAPGFVVFYGVCVSISWVIAMSLLIMEQRRICPGLYGRSHGFPLLLFWTISFVLMNLPLTSIGHESWWWKMER